MLRAYLTVITDHKKLIAFGLLATFFTNFGQTFFFGLYGEAFRDAYELSHTAFGTLYSGVTLASAVLIVTLGHMIDRIHAAPYSAILCLLLALGCLLIGLANSLPLFIIGIFLVRFLGQGMLGHMSSTVISRYIHERRGRALSITSMGYSLGEILLPLMVVLLLAWMSWTTSWTVFAAIYIAIAPLFLWLGRGLAFIEQPSTNNAIPDKTLRQVTHESAFWISIIASMFMPFFLTGVFFHQQWLMQDLGLSPTLFAFSFSIFGIAHIVSNITSGAAVDHFGATRMLKCFMIPFTIAALLFVLLPHPATLVCFMVCAATTTGILAPTRTAFLAERYGVTHLGAIKSIMTSSMVFSTALSPFLFGWLIDFYTDATLIFHIGWSGSLLLTLLTLRIRRN